MIGVRWCARNAKRILTSLVSLSVINVIYVMFKYDWTRDDVLFAENHQYGASSFLQEGQSGLACAHPQLELWPKDLEPLFQPPTPLECDLEQEDWVYVTDGKYHFSDSAIEKHGKPLCEAITFVRGDDDFTVLNGESIKPIVDGEPLRSDFSQVKCIGPTGGVFTSILSGIMYNESIHKRPIKPEPRSMNLDILMIGFDSVSRMTWLRNFPQTHKYFTSQLGGVVLEGYNIVGDGTPQALLPILTGNNETELPESRRGYEQNGARTVDGHPWIWKEMHRQGYVTQWAEDGASAGTFTYRMLGFRYPPVDHYMRPFYLRAEPLYHEHRPFCLGSRPRHVNMFEWSRDFFEMYSKQPKFSFIFHSELSHDQHAGLQLVDADLVSFLSRMEIDGHLDNTMLILMSDHGQRFRSIRTTLQGKYEERLPYFGIKMPSWFQKEHPDKYDNLLNNSHRLSSPFDIHETLREIIGLVGKKRSRGISLFKKIPKSRTCADAGIEPHWCACLNWKEISVKDKLVKSAAQEIVRTINIITQNQREKCAKLSLKGITSAGSYTPNDQVLRFKQSADDDGRKPQYSDSMATTETLYQLVIATAPNDAKYEVTVKYSIAKNKLIVNTRDISRINKYGSQPHCVQDQLPHLRPYCFCK